MISNFGNANFYLTSRSFFNAKVRHLLIEILHKLQRAEVKKVTCVLIPEESHLGRVAIVVVVVAVRREKVVKRPSETR